MLHIKGCCYPEDIAQALCKTAGVDGVTEIKDCTEALYQLRAIAENEFNSDYYRTFYAVLSKLAENAEAHDCVRKSEDKTEKPSSMYEYNVKGVTLTASEMADIHSHYEAMCTAEYLRDNYPKVRTEEQALTLGYAVHEEMSENGIDEEEAIRIILTKEGLYWDDEEEDEVP